MKPIVKLFLFASIILIPLLSISQHTEDDLPEISMFEAIESNGRIYIKWNLFNDVLYDNIILQRSIDAKVWTNLHYEVPKGDYKSNQTYHFIDTSAPKGVSYYRLTLVKRGKPSIKSKIEVVKIDSKGVIRCFPNPTTGIINFYIDSAEHSRGYLRIINGNGFVEHFEIIEVQDGVSAFKRDFSQLDPGIYIIKIDFDSGLSFSQQEIIQD